MPAWHGDRSSCNAWQHQSREAVACGVHTPAVCCRQVAPRHTVLHTADNTEAGFALFVFYPELPGKTAVNSHVVVVGASDCGLSVIETLVLHERLQFSAVTLLAPRGLHAGASDAHYTAELLQRLVSTAYHHHTYCQMPIHCAESIAYHQQLIKNEVAATSSTKHTPAKRHHQVSNPGMSM